MHAVRIALVVQNAGPVGILPSAGSGVGVRHYHDSQVRADYPNGRYNAWTAVSLDAAKPFRTARLSREDTAAWSTRYAGPRCGGSV